MESEVAETRPSCHEPVEGGCIGAQGPQWAEIPGADPHDDCGAVSCTGYYCAQGTSGSGIVDGQCFEKADQPATAVQCTAGGRCEAAAGRCPQETACATAAVSPPAACQQAIAGCIDETAPVYANAPRGTDPHGDCLGTCDGSGGCHAQQGEVCASTSECEPGTFCVDNRCCGSVSCPQCWACNLPGSLGTCHAVTAAEGKACRGVGGEEPTAKR